MTIAHRIACNHGLLLELALHAGELWEVTERRARLLVYVLEWYELYADRPLTGVWS